MSEHKNSIGFYQLKIREEEDKLKRINTSISIFQKQILNQKKHAGGINAGLENQNAVIKQVHILENRLDKTLQKLNDMMTANTSLRDKIKSLNREKEIFERWVK